MATAKRKLKVFRLPNVHPGSIIEYTYGYADNGLHRLLGDVISRPIPVRHYHLEFTDNGPFRLAFRLYNAQAEAHKERAELFQEQFTSKGLTVTIEPAEK